MLLEGGILVGWLFGKGRIQSAAAFLRVCVCVVGGELDEHIILHRSGLAGQRGLGLQAGFFPLPFASFEFEYGT